MVYIFVAMSVHSDSVFYSLVYDSSSIRQKKKLLSIRFLQNTKYLGTLLPSLPAGALVSGTDDELKYYNCIIRI